MGTISFGSKAALVFAPELGFQSLQTKTHLAVSGAKTAVTATTGEQVRLEPSAVPLTTSAAARGDAHSGDEPLPQRNSDAETDAAEPSKAAVVSAPEAPEAIVAPAPASSTPAGVNVVNLSDLADHLVNQAQTLKPARAAANPPLGATPIKELQLNLEPAHLGAVAVTLKLTNGKLSVDVGVANSTTLAAVEGQRETIVSKLQSVSQPLESFVVHQQAPGDANRYQASSDSASTGSLENASGNDSSSQDARERAPRQPRTPPQTVTPPRNSLRADLVV
jgi:flagellar hook-length control protein FliK